METTVKLRLGGELITCVVFGGIDFPVDTKVRFSFKGSDMLLFDRENRKLLSVGAL